MIFCLRENLLVKTLLYIEYTQMKKLIICLDYKLKHQDKGYRQMLQKFGDDNLELSIRLGASRTSPVLFSQSERLPKIVPVTGTIQELSKYALNQFTQERKKEALWRKWD